MELTDILYVEPEQQLKLKLAHSVEPNIYDARIDDICRKAGISRRTFYNIFSSKYDIPIWYREFICGHSLEGIGELYTWEKGFERYFSICIKEKEAILRNATAHHQGDPISLEATIELRNWRTTRSEHLWSALEKRGFTKDDTKLAYCVQMYTRIESHAARDWITSPTNGCPRTAADQLAACVPFQLYEALSM